MRILYISQYFPPEVGATQTRAYEMARNWVRLGHLVTMIAEIPNHPSGIIPPAYRGKLFERSTLDGIDVIRVWVYTSRVKSFVKRMLFYLTFMVNATIAGLLLAPGRYDLLYVSSPPLFVGGTMLLLSYFRKIPVVFEVRDLWPESAVALGELSNRLAISLSAKLEEACYRRAQKIVVVTQGIFDRLLERGQAMTKLVLITNGANVDLFKFDGEQGQQIRKELGFEDHFIVMYAGIHGVAQGLDTVIASALILQEHDQIHFLFIGDGPKRAEEEALVKQLQLSNLTFLGEKPREQIPSYLSAANVALIPLRNLDLFKGALPSKMFDAWACERPVILSVDGEARQVMEAAQGGLFVEPGNPQALAKVILDLKDSPEGCQRMGRAGRIFTEQHYSRQALAKKLINELKI